MRRLLFKGRTTDGSAEDEVQKLTDGHVKRADEALTEKKADLIQI